jgi:hypothetical protein
MIIYEVCLEVEASVKSEYEEWLPGHIEEVLKCRGFYHAEWYTIEDTSPASQNKGLWTVFYRVTHKECLEEYFALHAPRLRKDGIERFGDKFKASRRILSKSRVWSTPPYI